MLQKIPLYYTLPAIIISTLAVIAIVFAWQEPTAPPPRDNVPAPINVGTSYQMKAGPLTISNQFITTTSTLLATFGGNVGIGTTTPAYRLDVIGTLRATATSTFSANVGIGTATPTARLHVRTTDLTTVPFRVEALAGFDPNLMPGWNYRRQITISNSTSALTDYQVLVTLNTRSLIDAGKMRSDCGDIRFTDSNGSSLLNYWLESGCNTTNTGIWVKVPNIPSGTTKTIYVYYGNSAAPSVSSETLTFDSGEVEAFTNAQLGGWANSYDTYNVWYEDARNEIIYTFADFSGGASVYRIPLKIDKIKFFPVQTPDVDLANYRIRYQITTAQQVDHSFTTGGWTLIWGPITFRPTAGGGEWYTHDVTDFYWTGNNLRLDLSRDGNQKGSKGGMNKRLAVAEGRMCLWCNITARTWPFDGSCVSRSNDVPAVKFAGLLRKYTFPEPATWIGGEEPSRQQQTVFYIQNQTGNFGIGTTAPTEKLDVAGNVAADDIYLKRSGRWASQVGDRVGDRDCYWTPSSGGRTRENVSHVCPDGYYMKGVLEYISDYEDEGRIRQIYCCRF